MKKSLLIIFINFFAFLADAQSFATNDAEWVFDFNSSFYSGITKIKYYKDTLIGQRQIKLYSKQIYRIAFKRDSVIAFRDPICLHELDGVIEFSTDKINFDTLINYNAKIGQSWMIYRRNKQDSLRVTILDTFRSLISDQWLFSQLIQWTHFSKGTYHRLDTIYDQIGSRWTYLLPFDLEDVGRDGGEGGTIRCFKNNQLGIVSFPNDHQSQFEYDCDQLSNVDGKMPPSFDFSISPNPASDHIIFSIELDKSSSIRLKMINSLGELEEILIDQRYQLGQHSESISISHLPNGVYYCKLFEGGKFAGLKRFIKI